MALLPGTTNLSSLNVQDNLTVGGTMGVVGALAVTGAVTASGGVVQAATLFTAAGTVTAPSQLIVFNVAAAGFAVRIPAPAVGQEYRIVNQIAPASGTNQITLPSGGTIYQGTVSGTVLNFTTLGQNAWLIGLNSTQYRSFMPGTMNPPVA